MEIIYFFIVCLLASVLQCITGFGFAIICMPLLLIIFPFKTTAAVVALASLVLNSQVAFSMRKHINFRVVIIPIIASFAGKALGINALMTLNENLLKTMLGITLILITIYFIFYKEKVKVNPTKTNGAIFGFISGVLGGMFNTGGPPMVMYLLFAVKDKLSYIGSIQFIFAIGNLYSVILHILNGNLNISIVPMSLVGIVTVTIGSYIGCKLVEKIKDINTPIYISMILMGIFLIIESNIVF